MCTTFPFSHTPLPEQSDPGHDNLVSHPSTKSRVTETPFMMASSLEEQFTGVHEMSLLDTLAAVASRLRGMLCHECLDDSF